MAQGRSTKIISMNKWIRTSRLWIKNSPSLHHWRHACHLGLASAGVAGVPLWCTWERRGDVFLAGQEKCGRCSQTLAEELEYRARAKVVGSR